LSSKSLRSYSLSATQKRTAATSVKHVIHFLRSLRWPPTSTSLERKEQQQQQQKLSLRHYQVSDLRNEEYHKSKKKCELKERKIEF
jgi:hypothetical protein